MPPRAPRPPVEGSPEPAPRARRAPRRVVQAPVAPVTVEHTVAGMPVGRSLEPPGALARTMSLPGLTVEGTLYALLVVVALTVRLWQVDELPLGPTETRTAFGSLEIARGGRLPSDAGALLGFGNAAIFTVLGATDGLARLLPAIAGGLVPLALLPARPLLGRTTALIAAMLLTLSPLLIDRSRIVGSGAIAATIVTGLVFVVFDYARVREPRRLYQAAVLLGLALTAGMAAVPAVLALTFVGVGALIGHARSNRLPASVDEALEAIAPVNGHVPGASLPESSVEEPAPVLAGPESSLRALLLFAATLLLVSTGALTNLNGIDQGLFAPIAAYLDALLPAGMTAPLWLGPLTWLAYEPLVAILGLVGAVVAVRSGGRFERTLVLWLGLALLAALLAPEHSATLLASAVPPAAVLAAPVIRRTALAVPGVAPFLISLLVLGWGLALVIYGVGHVTLDDPVGVRYLQTSLGDRVLAQLVIGLAPVGLFLGALVYLWIRLTSARRPALGAAAIAVLFAFALHSGWNLAYQVVDNVAEIPRAHQTSLDARALASDVNEVFQVLTINRKEKTLVVDEAYRYPLAWYLRNLGPRFEAAPSGTPAVVVVPADAKAPATRYTGQQYRVSAAADPGFSSWGRFWRWFMYRELPVDSRGEDVMVFVRAQ